MKRKVLHESYTLHCDMSKRTCLTCRKTIKNEPYAIRRRLTDSSQLTMEMRCWRCWHTNEVTALFLQKYPDLFKRVKRGAWYYLELFSAQFIFPSTDGDFDPDG